MTIKTEVINAVQDRWASNARILNYLIKLSLESCIRKTEEQEIRSVNTELHGHISVALGLHYSVL